MIVNKYNTLEVYDKIIDWWKGHNFPPLSIDFLPEECFIISDNNLELYAMFFYHTNSNLCWIAFPVSNPLICKEDKKNGLELLTKGIIEYSKQCGYKYVFTTSPVKIIQETLLKEGFILGDENVNHYIKLI